MRKENLGMELIATYEAKVGGVDVFKVKPWEVQIGDVLVLRDVNDVKVLKDARRTYITHHDMEVIDEAIDGLEIVVDATVMSKIDNHIATIFMWKDQRISLPMLQKLTDEMKKERAERLSNLKTYSIRTHKTNMDEAIIQEMISKVDRKRLQILLSISASDYENKHFVRKETVDSYLRLWAEAKYDFYVMFGRELTIQHEYEQEMTPQEMHHLIAELRLKYPKYAFWLNKFESSEYVNNRISYVQSSVENLVDYCKVGMKVSGFFSKLFEDPQFDIDLSKVLQDKHIKGSLTISIDPYDYLTSSLNKHDWRSCHRITDGEYGTGSVSYLLDDTTMIAYKHNGRDYDYNFFGFKYTGNSKAFRQCIYFDKDSCNIIFGRNYPNSNDGVCQTIRTLLQEQVENFFGLPEDTIWVKRTNSYEEGVYEDISELHYSDVVNDWNFVFTRIKNSPADICDFQVGYNAPCLICGDTVHHEGECCICSDCLDERE